MKGGRLVWKDAEVKKKNLELMEAAPEEAASLASRPNFNGDWVCSAVSGERLEVGTPSGWSHAASGRLSRRRSDTAASDPTTR